MSKYPAPWRVRLAKWIVRQKSSETGFTIIPDWAFAKFTDRTFKAMAEEGQRRNGVVFACISALCFATAEPRVVVYDQEDEHVRKPVPRTHPLARLLKHPNATMGENELKEITVLYMAISGNAYWYKVRDKRGRVIQLLPLSDAQILPVPGGDNLISHYEWVDAPDWAADADREIPATDIVHFCWIRDPLKPWMGQGPLTAVASEIDTDNEATRYVYELLRNDAVPRVILSAPPDAINVDPDRIREEWKLQGRNGPAVLLGGLKVERMAMGLNEMAGDLLHSVPETRICAALGVPPIIAGVSSGLAHATYSNAKESRQLMAEGIISRLCSKIEDEIATDLVPEFAANGGTGSEYVAFDMSTMTALQPVITARQERAGQAFVDGILTLDEARAAHNLAPAPPEFGAQFYWQLKGSSSSTVPQDETPPAVPEQTAPKVFVIQGDRPKALPAPSLETIDEEDVAEAQRVWDEVMDGYEGLLDANR
jgi:HK97 family phage portal protein